MLVLLGSDVIRTGMLAQGRAPRADRGSMEQRGPPRTGPSSSTAASHCPGVGTMSIPPPPQIQPPLLAAGEAAPHGESTAAGSGRPSRASCSSRAPPPKPSLFPSPAAPASAQRGVFFIGKVDLLISQPRVPASSRSSGRQRVRRVLQGLSAPANQLNVPPPPRDGAADDELPETWQDPQVLVQ